jgi:hypothetical protein
MEAFPQCEQSFTFEQCYSGGFLDNLMNSGEPLRDFNSACAYNQLSYAMPPDYQYDEFVFDWTAALRGEDAYGNPVDADFNNDGYVCMYEAFRYAERNDQCNEDPQYASNPFPYGMYETMNGFIEVANIKFASTEVDDDTLGASMGNNNGQLNAGETIELSFEIKNAGTLDLSGLEGTLESADSMVTITSATCVFPDLPMLTMVSSAEDPFVFQVSPTCPAGDTIAFTLTITDSNDSTFTYNFNLVCQGADINTLTNSSIVAPIKAEFVLSPNPFNAQTELILELPQAGFVDLKVYDALGREIVTLIDGYQMSGRHTAIFNAENYSSGIYFFRLYYNGQTTILKSLLLK